MKGFRMRLVMRLLALLVAVVVLAPFGVAAQTEPDWITGLPRTSIQVDTWPGGKKVAICFALYVEEWGFGHGPNFRPDMVTRNPDLVNGAFREYGVKRGIPRVARLFKESDIPLSIALNALFPEKRPEVWKELRATLPNAPILGHGMNNSTDQLPMGRGLEAQKTYIRKTLDLIEQASGIRPLGWSSPSVYMNGDTFVAVAAEGVKFTIDAMDSDVLSELSTPTGPLMLMPYPVVTVDMGQNLARMKEPWEIERLWTDYVLELVREAQADPLRPATVVVIGIHPFVVGMPNGASALRRVLERISKEELVWLTDVNAVYGAANQH
jgi:peptidoglycan/xylan/chitin deacetylase (PgdA/CDA1 family)